MPVLHQLVAGFRLGDAISNEAVLIRDLCAQHGLDSDIRCPRRGAAPGDKHLVKDVEALPAEVKPDDIALLHLSIGSRCNEIFPKLPCRRRSSTTTSPRRGFSSASTPRWRKSSPTASSR